MPRSRIAAARDTCGPASGRAVPVSVPRPDRLPRRVTRCPSGDGPPLPEWLRRREHRPRSRFPSSRTPGACPVTAAAAPGSVAGRAAAGCSRLLQRISALAVTMGSGVQAPQPPLVHREDRSGRPRRSRCATPAIAPAGRARTSSTIVVRHGDDVRRRAPGARREQAAPHPCIPIRRRPPTPLPSRSRRAKRQPIALLSTRSRHRTGRGRRSVLCDPERDAGRDPGCDPAHNSGRNQPRYARAARDRSCRSVQSIRQDAETPGRDAVTPSRQQPGPHRPETGGSVASCSSALRRRGYDGSGDSLPARRPYRVQVDPWNPRGAR